MDKEGFGIRIIRSPHSNFYKREIEDCLKTHPDSYLKEVAREGFNAIWLHCLLRDIVPCSSFPEFGQKGKEQVPALNKLVEKAGKYGLKVFLYFDEPRGFREEDVFWKNHPDVKGQPTEFRTNSSMDGRYYALCTSTEKVRRFLSESSYNLFKSVPGLGGVFMITASEFHTHCYSHYTKWKQGLNDPNIKEWTSKGFYCERCAERDPSEVVAEIITLVNKGIKDASPEANVIVWNWTWYVIEPDPQKKIVSLLPKDVILMADFERGGWNKILNKRLEINEYSFSYTGPSPRFKGIYSQAKQRGMKIMAKLQMGVTHELATVPYIPVPYTMAEKIHRMKKMGVDGYLGCWIFGGNVSVMSKITGRMSINPSLSPAQAVKDVAVEEFGTRPAGYVTKAWKLFSAAWKNYPFSIPFLYYSTVNYATVYPLELSAKPVSAIPSYLALPRDKKGHLVVGDNLIDWLIPFTAGFAVKTFRKLLSEWDKGIKILEEGIKENRGNPGYQKEMDMAVHISLLIKSTINIIEFYPLLKKYRKGLSGTKRLLYNLLQEELSITNNDWEIIKKNPDFGYHAEAHTNFITESDLSYKIRLLKKQII